MKKHSRTLILIVIYGIVTTISTFAQESYKDKKIISVVNFYEQALNGNDVDRMLQLFTEDGIILLQGASTSIGTEAVGKFYLSLFKALDFDLKFNIDEVVQMSAEWAFIRTTSSGKVTILSNNSNNLSKGHELFILKKQADGNWKIARYAGSSAE